MIHITIPTFQTLVDKREPYKKYNVFDLHVNGVFHASVRYSMLYQLHERLVEMYGFRLDAPDFPPKVWRSCLDSKAGNERREGLAKYFQAIIQNPDIAKHRVVEKAFLEYQLLSFHPTMSSIKLEICLPDGRTISLECYSDDSTNVVMKKLCEQIGMGNEQRNSQYFGLFLAQPRCKGRSNKSLEVNGTTSGVLFDQLCIRWLKNFESPFISQQLVNKASEKTGIFHKLLVRKVIWDPSVEEPLLDDAGCLKLLFLQALNDVQRGVMRLPMDVKEKLVALQEQGNFKEFVRVCHMQTDYGYEQLASVVSDFPQADTHCQLKVGRRQIVLEYESEGTMVQSILRSTRIRIWKLSQPDPTIQSPITSPSTSISQEPQMTFQIEYLVGRQEFGIINLQTNQAVILSLFLQSIAAEILQDQPSCNSPTFKFDDSLSSRAIESLEVSKANSIVGDDLSIRETSAINLNYTDGTKRSSNASGNDGVDLMTGNEALWKIISHQMPFGDHETFEEITDADL